MADEAITEEKVRILCADVEGPRLDFKRDGYSDWSKGKHEFLKDLIAFGNTLPTADSRGHILLGVDQDPTEGTGTIVGFEPGSHLTEANLQQVAKDVLIKVPEFRYVPVQVDGKLVAVIEVRGGRRPYFAHKGSTIGDPTGLPKNIAWHRQGSRNTVASPDEIIGWAKEGGAFHVNLLQADLLDSQLTPHPRIKVLATNGHPTSSQLQIAIENVGEAPFSISRLYCEWRVGPDLAQRLRREQADTAVTMDTILVTNEHLKENESITIKPGDNHHFGHLLMAHSQHLYGRIAFDPDKGFGRRGNAFVGRLVVIAHHRTGREGSHEWPINCG